MTVASFRRYVFALGANQELTFPLTGEYFAVLASTGDFAIGIEAGPLSQWEAGLKVGNPVNPDTGRRDPFNWLRLQDLSGAANTVVLAVGSGDFTDSRLTVSGVVSVQGVAGGVAVGVTPELPGAAYSGTRRVAAGGAGNFSAVQLANPAASGIIVQIDRITIWQEAAAATGFVIGRFDTLLSNLQGAGFNHDTTEAAGAAEIRWENAQAAAFYAALQSMATPADQQTFTEREVFATPVALQPGEAMVARTSAANVAGHVAFEWRELAA